MNRDIEQETIAAWLAENKLKRLRKGRANAPPITKIRRLKSNEELVVRRNGGRDVVYRKPPRDADSQAAWEHPRAAARTRRRSYVRRLAQKPPA